MVGFEEAHSTSKLDMLWATRSVNARSVDESPIWAPWRRNGPRFRRGCACCEKVRARIAAEALTAPGGAGDGYVGLMGASHKWGKNWSDRILSQVG